MSARTHTHSLSLSPLSLAHTGTLLSLARVQELELQAPSSGREQAGQACRPLLAAVLPTTAAKPAGAVAHGPAPALPMGRADSEGRQRARWQGVGRSAPCSRLGRLDRRPRCRRRGFGLPRRRPAAAAPWPRPLVLLPSAAVDPVRAPRPCRSAPLWLPPLGPALMLAHRHLLLQAPQPGLRVAQAPLLVLPAPTPQRALLPPAERAVEGWWVRG
jgi:hypothetical protein